MKLLRVALLCLVCVLGISPVYAQDNQRTITGKIVDATSKEALVGVSVYVDNKTIGTATGEANVINNISIGAITNEKGEFTLKIPNEPAIKQLAVSYIGYESTVIVLTNSNHYNVNLSVSGKNLNEFVFTGYQTIRKSKSTGATDKITMDKINIAGTMSVDQMLQGQLAGVAVTNISGAPGQAPKIRIRGTSSLQGTQDPLWVVDGLPIEGTNLPDMNGKDVDQLFNSSIAGYSPADIESITVLKDAAATAIYGARAANGVIVVTTKSGKKGDKISVNYRNNFTFTKRPSLSRLDLLNSDEKVNLELDLYSSNYDYRSDYGDISRILQKYNVSPGDLSSLGFNGINANARNEINALRGINTDWNSLLFQNAFTQEHSVSVSGGGDKSAYYFSGGYYDEQGATRGTGADRYNITLKTDFDLSKKVKFSANMFANQRTQQSYLSNASGNVTPTFYSRRANPYTQVTDANGDYVYDRNILGDENILNFNILEEQRNTRNKSKTTAINTNFKLDYEVIKGLHLSSQLGIQSENNANEAIALENTYYVRQLADVAMRLDPNTGTKSTYLPKGGVINNTQSSLLQYTLKTMAEYNFAINKKHDFNVLVGNELRRIKMDGFTKVGYGYDPQTLTTTAPLYQNDNEMKTLFRDKNIYRENAFASFFGTASYTYNNKYTIGGSLRFDGSDLFGVDPKYKYLPLWSVSGLWRVKEENFLRDVDFLNMLNLRASYGLQGNIDKSTSPFVMGSFGKESILPGDRVDVIEVTTPPNAKLRWEKTTNSNIGIDFAVFKSAVNVTVDYYTRHGKDLINQRVLPLETGFPMMSMNWAEMKNSGVEVSISTRNISRKDFRWTTDFNFSYNKNEVLRETLHANADMPSREGYPVNAIFGYEYAGLSDKGMIMVMHEGKKISMLDLLQLQDDFAGIPGLEGQYPYSNLTAQQLRGLYTYMGSGDPLYTGGITNNFRYKQFDLAVGLMFNLGQKVRIQPYYNPIEYNRGMNTNKAILDRFSAENPTGKYPMLIGNNDDVDPEVRLLGRWFNQKIADFNNLGLWVKDGGYVRVRNITLGYSLTPEMARMLRLKGLRITAEARNPFVFAGNYDGFLDPETMGNPYAQPIPKTYTIGLNVNF
ncbi:TonB-linked SusC/RagA family outer membrane protein [Chitinophaga skermanii]|uniref:TonB-linked SusC/RagA family outer membrane protein n=1 Tax=Chitinophaga skermanii TaxID=331697 RepID=A0A327QZ37_9BACT|nr:SusC/RagA family TonB-linked outer membrane protein [Chitinophaga skermanii]RAJ08693.1 TonB-linked SusC/RagA family outer membrane protein [Chitinophaga skermanii]